ncbi:SpoIID/LytB domain-containing protein [Salinibacter sp. 10B]|uniref:SpoIID/LytB domain-containing protein n=1 Tax=Salinibacter sp. 10B TaxID=1923971 RepID=UPI000CF42DC1|nr:SpoIID/LytB domain-containing protein [Salinibacter sp. 10B]
MMFSRPSSWFVLGLLLAFGLPSSLTVLADPSPADTSRVRVRLNHRASIETVKLTVDEGPLAVHLPSGGAPVMRLQSGETTTLGLRQSDVYIRRGADGLYATELQLRPAGSDAAWTLSFNNAKRTYTGGLYLAPDAGSGLLVVNDVPIEDYVASVVASEYGLDDTEGKKAMAVVARTYGLFASAKFGGAYDHADGTASQVYNGLDAVTKASRQAAQATAGEVLTHDGTLIQAVYFSSSGGHTANNEDVWNAKEPIPYLRGKKDPYDTVSPHHTWSASVDRSPLLQALTRKRGSLVNGFVIDDRSPDGRVKTIKLLHSDGPNHRMNANTFRLVVNQGVDGAPLKSTWFDARRSGDTYIFDGHGFGHGVGLSQWGAHGMAEQGHSYRDILHFYYTDVEIHQLNRVQKDPVDAPVAKDPRPAPSDSTTTRRIGW